MLDEGVRAGGDECRIRLCFTLRKPTPTALTTLTATHYCIPLVTLPFSLHTCAVRLLKEKEKKYCSPLFGGIFRLPGQQDVISLLHLNNQKMDILR